MSNDLGKEIVERIMSAHWDMAACKCWVCDSGRKAGYCPRKQYLPHYSDNRERFPVPRGKDFGW